VVLERPCDSRVTRDLRRAAKLRERLLLDRMCIHQVLGQLIAQIADRPLLRLDG
jgi:hypothetical protein